MTLLLRIQRLMLILFILNSPVRVYGQEGDDASGGGGSSGGGGGEKKRFMADLRNEKDPDEVFQVISYINDVFYTPTQAQEIYMGTLNLLRYRWPSSTIPVKVSSQFKPQEKIVIWRTLGIIERDTCIRFIAKRAIDTDYVELTKNHYLPIRSHLGITGGMQNINLHSAQHADKYTILHLFLHTLGFPHQHIVPNRDDHVKVLWENILQLHKSDFIRLTKMEDSGLFKDYDATSIMHYDSYAGTRNGKPTILTKDGKNIWPNATLSKKDFEKLHKFYAC